MEMNKRLGWKAGQHLKASGTNPEYESLTIKFWDEIPYRSLKRSIPFSKEREKALIVHTGSRKMEQSALEDENKSKTQKPSNSGDVRNQQGWVVSVDRMLTERLE
eukprot:TRINITY_DN85116_c0_g1_i1.p1 TRINITY_DN85116_c0_g1~~TRINITY_DN85116_c0_g1_i1.p1  ORF type:complete len:105 (+),score=25.87 TRINITY_DN85116_c0_g1_i1:345-659(+)